MNADHSIARNVSLKHRIPELDWIGNLECSILNFLSGEMSGPARKKQFLRSRYKFSSVCRAAIYKHVVHNLATHFICCCIITIRGCGGRTEAP